MAPPDVTDPLGGEDDHASADAFWPVDRPGHPTTVEGTLLGVADFARGARRATGLRGIAARAVVSVLLLGFAAAVLLELALSLRVLG